MPYTTQITGCYNANSCDIEGQVLTVTNADYNASLSPSNTSASFNIKFETDEADYSLNILDVQFKTGNTTTDPDPTPNPNPDKPTAVDYVKISYVMQNDWGSRQLVTFSCPFFQSRDKLSNYSTRARINFI